MPQKRRTPSNWNFNQQDIAGMHLPDDFRAAFEAVNRAAYLASMVHNVAIDKDEPDEDKIQWLMQGIQNLMTALADARKRLQAVEKHLMLAFESLKDVYLPTYAGAPGSAHAAVLAIATKVWGECGLRAEEATLDIGHQWKAIAQRLAELPDIDAETLTDLMKREAVKASTDGNSRTAPQGPIWSAWLTKEAIADKLGISAKTLNRRKREGKYTIEEDSREAHRIRLDTLSTADAEAFK